MRAPLLHPPAGPVRTCLENTTPHSVCSPGAESPLADPTRVPRPSRCSPSAPGQDVRPWPCRAPTRRLLLGLAEPDPGLGPGLPGPRGHRALRFLFILGQLTPPSSGHGPGPSPCGSWSCLFTFAGSPMPTSDFTVYLVFGVVLGGRAGWPLSGHRFSPPAAGQVAAGIAFTLIFPSTF